MYAHFEAILYQVSLSIGTGGSASSSSINVYYGSTNTFTVTPNSGYYLESLTCTNGYTASGYSTGTSATGTQTVTISNNNKPNSSTCTIKFAPIGYTISYVYNGVVVKNALINKGENITNYIPPSVNGKTFKGWTTDKSNSNPQTLYANGDTTLYGIATISSNKSNNGSVSVHDAWSDLQTVTLTGVSVGSSVSVTISNTEGGEDNDNMPGTDVVQMSGVSGISFSRVTNGSVTKTGTATASTVVVKFRVQDGYGSCVVSSTTITTVVG